MTTRSATAFSIALAAAGGLLCVLALVQQLGWGQGYHWLADEAQAPRELEVTHIEREQFKLPAEASFSDIALRPIFNDDRKPSPEAPAESVASEAAPAQPLNVILTGIILTPELRLAMLRDNVKNIGVALKEGMPMPGDQGSWTLVKIKPRSAVFKGSGDDNIEVELTAAADAQKQAQPGKPGYIPNSLQPPSPMPMPMMPKPEAASVSKQAEELQHRIEERRRQMREEAEKLKQHGSNPPPETIPNQNLANPNTQNQNQ